MILTLDDAQEYIEKLEAENAELKKQVANLEQEVQDTFTCIISHHEEEIKNEVEPLRQQVEDMKCCGNCKYREGNYCINRKIKSDLLWIANKSCPYDWQSDNLTKEERNDG